MIPNKLAEKLQNVLDEIHDAFQNLRDEISDEKERADDAYDDGYSDGAKEAGADARNELRSDVLDFMGLNDNRPWHSYGPPKTEKQPRGWITFNGDYFGFGDTAEESMVDYFRKVEELCQC